MNSQPNKASGASPASSGASQKWYNKRMKGTQWQKAIQLSIGFSITVVFVVIPTLYTFNKNSRKVVQPHQPIDTANMATNMWQKQLYDDRLALRERIKVLKQMEIDEQQQALVNSK